MCSSVFVIYFEPIYHLYKESSIQIFTRVLNTHLVLCESPGRNFIPSHILPNFKCHTYITEFHDKKVSRSATVSFGLRMLLLLASDSFISKCCFYFDSEVHKYDKIISCYLKNFEQFWY